MVWLFISNGPLDRADRQRRGNSLFPIFDYMTPCVMILCVRKLGRPERLLRRVVKTESARVGSSLDWVWLEESPLFKTRFCALATFDKTLKHTGRSHHNIMIRFADGGRLNSKWLPSWPVSSRVITDLRTWIRTQTLGLGVRSLIGVESFEILLLWLALLLPPSKSSSVDLQDRSSFPADSRSYSHTSLVQGRRLHRRRKTVHESGKILLPTDSNSTRHGRAKKDEQLCGSANRVMMIIKVTRRK